MYKLKNGGEFILASGSPRRKELLESVGLAFQVVASNVEEILHDGELVEAYVRRLALEKAQAVASKFSNAWVLGADTDVVIEGEILGKPSSQEEAKKMLFKLQGRAHEVWGAFALVHVSKGVNLVESSKSIVRIASLDEETIKAYVNTGEPLDKAGAYAAQGIGSSLVERVDGSYTNVVGLCLSSVILRMQELGVIEVVG